MLAAEGTIYALLAKISNNSVLRNDHASQYFHKGEKVQASTVDHVMVIIFQSKVYLLC